MKSKKKVFLIFSLSILLSLGAYFSFKTYQNFQESNRQRILLEKRKAAWRNLEQVLENKVVSFKGEAGIVIKDLDMDWEISFGKDKLFPSASLAKIPIMVSCFHAVGKGKINIRDTLTLKLSDKVSGSGILKDMPVGGEFTIEKLIELMISDSDNTATNMLIDLMGFDYFNRSFKEFGLKDTNLVRKMMDFKYRKKGIENFTTAEDIVYILEKLYRREFLNSATSERCLALLKQQKIRDRIPAKLPSETVVAHKTGLERNVCHDAGIVFTCKGDFLICALTKDADSAKAAKEFISTIAKATYDYYQYKKGVMVR